MKKRIPFHLPKRAQVILLALMRALIHEPEDLVVHDRDAEFLRRCEILLREFPWLTRRGFLVVLYLFDLLVPFFCFSFLRFIHLKLTTQKKYIQRWQHSQFHFIRETFKTLRGLVMMTYFSHKDVWAYVGYFPEEHVKERIKLRQRLLKEHFEEALPKKA